MRLQLICFTILCLTVLICSPPVINDRFLTFDCPDGYGYGSSCSLSCMGSFPLVGNDVITCERNNDSMATYWDVGSETSYCKSGYSSHLNKNIGNLRSVTSLSYQYKGK